MGAIILKYKSDKVSSAFYEVDFGGNVKGWLRKRGDKKKEEGQLSSSFYKICGKT